MTIQIHRVTLTAPEAIDLIIECAVESPDLKILQLGQDSMVVDLITYQGINGDFRINLGAVDVTQVIFEDFGDLYIDLEDAANNNNSLIKRY